MENTALIGTAEGKRQWFQLKNARYWVEQGFKKFVQQGKPVLWLQDYEQLVEWLTDTQGMGLTISGSYGLGKTLFCTRILPAILEKNFTRNVFVVAATDLVEKRQEIIKHSIVVIDDLGTEPVEYLEFGNKIRPFEDVMDILCRRNKLVIINTNLTFNGLKQRYGQRAFERIIECTIPVVFTHQESLRHPVFLKSYPGNSHE